MEPIFLSILLSVPGLSVEYFLLGYWKSFFFPVNFNQVLDYFGTTYVRFGRSFFEDQDAEAEMQR